MSLSAVLCAVVAVASPVERISFEGWPGAIRLSNGVVDLVVVPEIGRVVRFGFVGGPNVLWLHPELRGQVGEGKTDWRNFGGDKLWTAPQSDWVWPPDPDQDGRPHRLELRRDGVRLTSPVSERFGTRFVREIRLRPERAEVEFRNVLRNEGKVPRRMAVWQVTQVDDPAWTMLRPNPAGRNTRGWHDYDAIANKTPDVHTTAGDYLVIRRAPTVFRKYGSDHPSGTIWGRMAGGILEMSAAFDPKAEYPDQNSMQQIYVNGDPLKYAELELAGPLTDLAPGKSTRFDVRWRLKRG